MTILRRVVADLSRFWVLLVIGGALAVLGSVLPWETVEHEAGTTVRSGLETSDAYVSLILGLLVGVAGVVSSRRSLSIYWRGILTLCVIPILLVAVFDGVELQRSIDVFNGATSLARASLGIGLPLIGAGALLAIVGILRMPRVARVAAGPVAALRPPSTRRGRRASRKASTR